MKILMYIIMGIILMSGASAINIDLLTTNPAPIKAGEFADITFQIESNSNEMRYSNVNVEIVPTDFIKVISAVDAFFDEYESGRITTRTFRIYIEEDLPEGFVDLRVNFVSKENTFKFDKRVFIEGDDSKPELLIGQITTVPKELLPDTDNNIITVVLQNLGDKDAELVKAELKSSDGVSSSYSFSMDDSVSSIDGGKEGTFEFTIDLDETILDSIPSQLNIRYRTEVSDEYKTHNVIIPFNLEIVEAPLLKITAVEQENNFVGGTAENKLLVTVTNEGKEDAEEVRVRLVPDISYPFVFETATRYVSSNIKPGESATISFTTEVTTEAEDKTYDLTVKLESLVGDARYVREDVLSINTVSGSTTGAGTIGAVVVVIVLLLAGFIGFKRYKKRKK